MNLSSSSSSSLHLNSNPATAAGCLTGILRRLLCGSLRRTTPRDAEEAESADAPERKHAEPRNSPVPGIVARLMGLESLPVSPPRSIGRSRSTNSLDSWPGFLSDRRKSGGPASRSFREVPTQLREENEEFLLLSFTPDDVEGTFSSSGTKPKMGFSELSEVKAEGESRAKRESRTERTMGGKKVIKKSGRRRRENTSERNRGGDVKGSTPAPKKDVYRKLVRGAERDSSAKHRETTTERSMSTRKKLAFNNRKLELEFSSQNSSPVSVLDPRLDTDGEVPNSPDSPVSGDDRKPKRRDSRMKLSPDLADRNDPSPSIHLSKVYKDRGMRPIDEHDNKLRKPDQAFNGFSEMWRLILRLAEEDVKISNWVSRGIRNSADSGEIAALVGLEILDSLLCETVAELSGRNIKV